MCGVCVSVLHVWCVCECDVWCVCECACMCGVCVSVPACVVCV